MYENKIRDKFENFDNDFKYEGHYRDKEKKTTIIKLKCKKCDSILEKDQGNLMKRAKTLLCWNCGGGRKSQQLDYNIIINNSIINGCSDLVLIKPITGRVIIAGVCKCGNKFSKHIRRLDSFNYSCENCSYINNGPHTEEDVHKWFIDNGLTPTFDKYRGTKQKLSYICICGEESHIRYKRRTELGEDFKPMCRKCAIDLKMSGENASNWKGGIEGKRFDGEWSWSSKVKKKFGNKCCITNECEDLISHHLNAVNLDMGDCIDIDNGVCISKTLHIEFHSRYDKFKGTCTRKDFEEFFLEKTNMNYNDYLETLKK